MSSKPILLLLETGKKTIRFELSPNKDFILGSDAQAHLRVEGAAVSKKHVSLRWDGKTLLVRDLETPEGTLRLPQGAPFLELSSQENGELTIQIGDHKIRLCWFLDAESLAPERSEVKKSTVSPTTVRPPKVVSPPIHLSRREERTQELTVELSVGSRLRAFENLSLLLLLAVIFRTLAHIRDKMDDWQLWTIPSSYRRGIAIDYLYLYLHDPLFQGTIFVGLFGVLFSWVGISPLGKFFANRFGQYMSSRVLLIFSAFRFARITGALFSLLLIVWTPILSLTYGYNLSDTQFLVRVNKYVEKKNPKEFDFDEKAKTFTGSSLLYKAWVLSQREDLINRCRGFGLESWSGQRSCSVLFFSRALEGYARFQPRIVQELAASQVLLASLDGLIRVFSLEGPGSPVLDLFLDPLDDVGLGDEKQQIVSYIGSFEGLNFDRMIKGLVEMRNRTEDTANRAQKKLPKSFTIRFPGPLELGF
jgi:hypothetical protein